MNLSYGTKFNEGANFDCDHCMHKNTCPKERKNHFKSFCEDVTQLIVESLDRISTPTRENLDILARRIACEVTCGYKGINPPWLKDKD
jgi:hypothetical protein